MYRQPVLRQPSILILGVLALVDLITAAIVTPIKVWPGTLSEQFSPDKKFRRTKNFGGRKISVDKNSGGQKISAGKNSGGQNFSLVKIFGSNSDFRQFYPPKFFPIRYYVVFRHRHSCKGYVFCSRSEKINTPIKVRLRLLAPPGVQLHTQALT